MTDDDQEIIDRTVTLVGRVLNQFHSRVAEFGLSAPEAKALLALQPGESSPMRTVADRVHSNPSNLTVVVSRLQSRGLVTVDPADDRRVRAVALTEAGTAMRARLDDRLVQDHPALHGLSANQRTAFLRILRRLDDAAHE